MTSTPSYTIKKSTKISNVHLTDLYVEMRSSKKITESVHPRSNRTVRNLNFLQVSELFSPTTQTREQKPNQSYLTVFCNFYSYFFIFPFKLTWCPVSYRFNLTSSRPRKILCCIMQTTGILATTPYLAGSIYNLYRGLSQPSLLLTSAANFLCFITPIELLKTLWLNTHLILDVANWHFKMNINHHVPLYKSGLFCILVGVCIPLANPLAGLAGALGEFTGVSSHKGFIFNVTFSGYSDKKFIVGPFSALVYIILEYAHLYYFVSTGFILALTLTVRESLLQMPKTERLEEQDSDLVLHQGVKMDYEIRKILNVVNGMISSKILFEYLLLLSFYAQSLNFLEWNYDGSFLHQLHVLLYLLFSAAFWLCACEIYCLSRNYLKNWVHAYRSTFLLESPQKLKQYQTCLLAMQIEADLNPTCISCRCFNITYGFLGSMFGLLITYSTIVYQMKSDKS